jgi:serine/threonine-protein kinase HipA
MMTSDRECFVFIQLPGSLETVTCGKYVRQILRDGSGIGRFVYGRGYREREDAVEIDPYNLPLVPREFTTAKLQGVFGALRDAAPDAWGRYVIERFAGRTDLNEVDYLLQSPEDRAGALSFGRSPTPPPPRHEFNRIIHLSELRHAAKLLEEDPDEDILVQLQHLKSPRTSIGGARPKNVVEDEDGLWIAKFPSRADRWNNAAVEAALLSLAGLCGIRVPATRVEPIFREHILLVERFDRQKVDGGYLRHRMVSALTMLDADDGGVDKTGWSYVLLADELKRWSSHPDEDRAELFRRMAFNALVSNIDDHPRNHAVIAAGRNWRLSPAYDITPSPSLSVGGRDLALICGLEGRVARRSNLVSQAGRFGLSNEEANNIIDGIREVVVARWEGEVRSHGGSDRDIELIAPAFLYPGFEYAPG